jgi:hypothetical protein
MRFCHLSRSVYDVGPRLHICDLFQVSTLYENIPNNGNTSGVSTFHVKISYKLATCVGATMVLPLCCAGLLHCITF